MVRKFKTKLKNNNLTISDFIFENKIWSHIPNSSIYAQLSETKSMAMHPELKKAIQQYIN